MNIKKNWLYILLFSLSLNMIGEYFSILHQDAAHIEKHEHIVSASSDLEYDDCEIDSCHCTHVKSLLDSTSFITEYLSISKPYFKYINLPLVSNTVQLLKPPIV